MKLRQFTTVLVLVLIVCIVAAGCAGKQAPTPGGQALLDREPQIVGLATDFTAATKPVTAKCNAVPRQLVLDKCNAYDTFGTQYKLDLRVLQAAWRSARVAGGDDLKAVDDKIAAMRTALDNATRAAK